ncbi:MAG: molybdopterin cofactor-binding domain-containing protein, partial [Pseudomonadota bacterium]
AAAKRVNVEFAERRPGIDPATAAQAAPIHDYAPENRCFDWAFGDEYGVDKAIDAAAHVTTLTLVNNRLIPNALEPRAALAAWDAASDRFTLYTTSQNPHLARQTIAKQTGLMPERKLRVVSPDVGGGFGSKIFVYPEECVCLWASKKCGRPVKWVSRRTESFLTDAHGRDHVTTATLALDQDGRFTALKVKNTANLGAYLSGFSTFVPTYLYATALAGPYKTPEIHCAVQGVYTNTAPVDAYRGAGRPEAVYVLESLVDTAARETGRDPAELRRTNLIEARQFPYQTPVAMEYDIGDFHGHFEAALARADYAGFETRRADAELRGVRRGLGLSCFVEACGIGPSSIAGALGVDVGLWESGTVRITPDGQVTAFTGAHAHGQGHETTFAQLLSRAFGVAAEDIEIFHGDTANTSEGRGTYGSRSLVVGGSALVKAAEKVVAKAKTIAAHKLRANETDIAFDRGVFHVIGTEHSLRFGEVAAAAYAPYDYPFDLEPGLEATVFYDPANFTFPSGTHVCEVEIDPDTGEIEIVQFVAVDDFGHVVNAEIVGGQVHGGLAQGIGQALFEQATYDPATGALQTSRLRDYHLPRAENLPIFQTAKTETRCTHNPIGAKGCGEAGTIGAPPAVMNAIADALGKRLDMPATPEKIWRALQMQADRK